MERPRRAASGTGRCCSLSFLALFTLGNSALMPHARSWKQERDVKALLASEPLFAAVLADEPSLREPLRAGLLKAFRSGERGEALLVGQRLLSPRLWRYVPEASDAAALGLGRALVATLTDLQARDPEQCYRFLYPAVAGPPRGGAVRPGRPAPGRAGGPSWRPPATGRPSRSIVARPRSSSTRCTAGFASATATTSTP